MVSVIVTHSLDDECPGHTITMRGDPLPTDRMLEVAAEIARHDLGDTHACDLDWENCVVLEG